MWTDEEISEGYQNDSLTKTSFIALCMVNPAITYKYLSSGIDFIKKFYKTFSVIVETS